MAGSFAVRERLADALKRVVLPVLRISGHTSQDAKMSVSLAGRSTPFSLA
jgi:hypothetical protein